MRAWIAVVVLCTACRTTGRPPTAGLLSAAERAVAGCYRVVHWTGPVNLVPGTDVLLDSAADPPEQPRQRRWRPLPRTPSGRARATWMLFRDSAEVMLLEPQRDLGSTGYWGRLGLRGDTLAGRFKALRDFEAVSVDESANRPTPAPNFRAVRVPCGARLPSEPPGT